ncbi:flagellar motor protein MotB [Rhodospirillum centenum]|uniref:Chemotaxis MotB protein n=2 Tax=Rhodospirillum centenum TaxID=34018 RepID=B6IQC6_RHOCS|nr:flagellar motor protein MotB [Rhodospirillum centenum]AAF35851.1 lateral flagellar motor protein MotB [Rhodospirillum centenum]ACI97662.1 chemotaxis MotB protein [Rhodospirillum centenum SW]
MTGKPQKPQIVIKRRAQEESDELEGNGTWKIAYADFVTAMMAFFMLLWLVNVTTPEQRHGIADYFNPIAVSDANSGANGQLAGQSVAREGALTSNAASAWETIPTARVPTLSPPGPDRELDDGEGGGASAQENAESAPADGNGTPMTAALEQQLQQVAAEEQSFDRIEQSVRDALMSAVDLADLSQNLVFERTADGLRIQITDRPHFSMFDSGATDLNGRAVTLLGIVAEALSGVPNRIAISGHTDGRPFAANARYGNWELSADRANAARRVLLQKGIQPGRVARVEGLADTLHLLPEDPGDPRNRRISIIVMRRVPLPGASVSQ